MQYGMPYQGSKSKLALKILDSLPDAENFFDLFGGGGAMAHAAAVSSKRPKIRGSRVFQKTRFDERRTTEKPPG